jgi:hypothetical protein
MMLVLHVYHMGDQHDRTKRYTPHRARDTAMMRNDRTTLFDRYMMIDHVLHDDHEHRRS